MRAVGIGGDRIVARLPLAVRIGVTGQRLLPPDALEPLRRQISALFIAVSTHLERLRHDPLALDLYDLEPARLRVISPLAMGADRLVAECAVAHGADLVSPLPFLRTEYERDFPQDIEGFRALLGHAQVFEHDGARGAFEDASYGEVGRFVVRNSDLLIAIWDGRPERGPGGTAEIVRVAAQTQTPVWFLDVSGTVPPRWIDGLVHLRDISGAPSGPDAESCLARAISRTVLAPGELRSNPPSPWAWFKPPPTRAPLSEYLKENWLSERAVWRTYARLMKALGAVGDVPKAITRSDAGMDPWWEARFVVVDRLANAYGDRYRSSYILIATLSFCALMAIAVSSVIPHAVLVITLTVEAIALACIGALILANRNGHWHEKWVSYRLLAELYRKQSVLSALGRAVPTADITRLFGDENEMADDGGADPLPGNSWVVWYFAAVRRAAPLPSGRVADATRKALVTTAGLVSDQIAYHRVRRARNAAANARLSRLGQGCFIVTVACGASKFALFMAGNYPALAVSAALGASVSAASAAFVGIRAYADYSLLVRQSSHMLRLLHATAVDLTAVPVDQPLASRELGDVLSTFTLSMMQDVSGWAHLFRIRSRGTE